MRIILIYLIISSMVMFGCWRKVTHQDSVDQEFQRALEKIQKDPIMGLNVDSIKEKYGAKFYELRTIINKNDPMGLIKMGAPEDEYDSEVKTILVQLGQTKNENEILDLVYTEFEKWFGNAGKKDNYKNLSTQIYIWTKNK